ncbi:MAG: phosphatidylserine decarboxylase family protein [Pirellulaceae bacterium]
MSQISANEESRATRAVEPLPRDIRSIQPGGGFCMAVELAWGHVRRWSLRRFRPGYVRRMQQLRRGQAGDNYPHEILDPRDLKFYRNQGELHWRAEDDPFAWRDRLPVARVGWAEIWIIAGGLVAFSALVAWFYWPGGLALLVLAAFLVCFFRNPRRSIPQDPGVVVSPADGRVFSIREVDYDDYLAGPAVVIDIFLSVFDVHLNRLPMEARVMGVSYRRGKFLNALRPEAARENESLEIRLQTTGDPVRALRVRQITGAIARRIVCWVRPGEHLPIGALFGMIKLGSRTELTFPLEEGMEIRVQKGQKVCAGTTVMAQYRDGSRP